VKHSHLRPNMVSLSSQKSITSPLSELEPPEVSRYFDGTAPLELGAGRLYDLLEVRCYEHMPGFEQGYVVEMEAQERSTQNSTWIKVKIGWEEMYGHSTPPSERVLLWLARREVADYLAQNRFSPRFSSLNRAVVLHLPSHK
jgi:hypothetical protein